MKKGLSVIMVAMSSYKKFVIALIAILTASAAILAIFLLTQPRSTNPASGQKISISGTIACLPPKNADGPHTLECAMGLKTNDNSYYALQNLPAKYSSGTKTLTVEGVQVNNSSVNDKYNIKGIIAVESVKEN